MSGSMRWSKHPSVILGLLAALACPAAYAQMTPSVAPPPVSPQASGMQEGMAFGARLSGIHETPSIFTPATGQFEATLGSQQLTFMLSYAGLSAPVTAAHIHFAQDRVAGAIIAFLCGGDNKPPCPQEGPVNGTIVPSDIIAVEEQGVPAGAFDALVAAMVSGAAYANVHTQAHPAGEIRGQIGP